MIALFAAAAAAIAAPSDATGRLADLQHLYSQSCEVRAYATFDDLCDQLKRQMREAQRAERDAARARAATPKQGTQALVETPAKD